MFHRSVGATAAAIVLALVVGWQPALAVSVLKVTGKVGYWQGLDDPGAVCVHSPITGQLRKIRVRAPTVVKGAYRATTWVGWRFQIVEPVPFERGRNIYRSPVWKDEASRTVAADGFTEKAWFRPADMRSTDGYHVYIILYWYAKGSKTLVEGKVLGGYEEYRVKKGTQSYRNFGVCTDKFGG